MPPISNKIQDVFGFYKHKIQSIYSERESQSILYLLFEHLFALSRIDICTEPNRRLSESEIVLVYDAVEKLLQHIPVQYVIGKTEFYGLPFFVNSATLIPRPETEELVKLILQNAQNQVVNVLDIGTGSGAIAISLKKQHPQWNVSACDISSDALEIAQKNAIFNQTEIHFFLCDILSKADLLKFKNMTFDIIVSNPPYIPESEKEIMRANVVDYEPHTALFVSDDHPLIFYETIAELSKTILSENGKLFFEIHENQGESIKNLLQFFGFHNVSIIKDLFSKNRFAIGFQNIS